jgi:raffinose/stachyose/melibiose transport system permease protein
VNQKRHRDLGYVPFLIPGAILTIFIVALPLVMDVGISFTRWQGVGAPTWIGLDNYVRLLGDRNFWASFAHIVALIVAMAIMPTIIGLVLAALLFDYVARVVNGRVAGFFRAGYYLPQILPVVVAGIAWGWILHPDGALNAGLKAVGLGGLAHDWLGDPSTALSSVMVMMIWFQIGYPLVIFMAGLQRVDPQLYEAAELDGASWLQRFLRITIHLIRPEILVVLLTTTIAPQGVRTHLRADERRAGHGHDRAVVLRLPELLREGERRLRVGHIGGAGRHRHPRHHRLPARPVER